MCRNIKSRAAPAGEIKLEGDREERGEKIQGRSGVTRQYAPGRSQSSVTVTRPDVSVESSPRRSDLRILSGKFIRDHVDRV